MGKINLGKEKGVSATDMPMPHTIINENSGMAGIYSAERANDRLIAGMQHVSDTLFKIYNDQADIRNRQEILEGQTALFDIENSEDAKLEERINKGEFDNEGGLDAFKKAVMESQGRIDRQFSDWTSKHITQSNTRNYLMQHAKLNAKKNFANISGRFLAHDRKRRWDMYQNQTNDAIETQNEANLMAVHKAYFGDGSKENPFRFSKETRERAWAEARRKFDERGLEIRLAQADQLVNADTQAAMYSAILNDLENGKYDGLYYSESSKLISKLKEGFNKIDYRNEIVSIRAALSKDLSNMSQQQFDEWEKSTIAEIEAKEHLSNEEKTYYKEKISAKRKTLSSQFVRNAQESYKKSTLSLLEAACANGNGDVDLSWDFVRGAELERLRAEIDAKEGSFFSIGKKAQEYDDNFHNIMRKIDEYKPDKDNDGLELRGLVFRTQGFLREHRIMLLNSLNNKAKGITPDKWSQENLEIFENQIDEMFDWYDVKQDKNEEKDQIKEEPRAVAFYQLRNSIIEDVKRLGLTPLEAQEYLQKHPIYKRLKDNQTYADAVDFLGGMANWTVPDISKTDSNAEIDYNHPPAGSLKNISEWRGRRYFGM